MPVSRAQIARVDTTYSIVPKTHWYGLVSSLASKYEAASEVVSVVEGEVDADGVHTSPLYGSKELSELRNLLSIIRNHKCQAAGETINWAKLGVTFSGDKMLVDKTSLEVMQNSTADADKVEAFLKGMSNNTGSIRPAAGAFGEVQRQYSTLKKGGVVTVSAAANTCATQLRSVQVTYNGGARNAAGSYSITITESDCTTNVDANFALAVSGADPSVLEITGAGGNLGGSEN